MSSEHGYYRHPTIAGNTIAFVCEDDLWSVSAEGGAARRLTANPGSVQFPAYSPDGSRIALIGRDDGPTEVYVMDAQGGRMRRLTWLGSVTQVVGWAPSGKHILFATDWRKAFMKDTGLYAIPAEGGAPELFPVGPARAVSFEPDGRGVVLGRNSGDPARWKRYRGGTAGTLWIDRAGRGDYAPLLRLRGNLSSPMWIGSRIYFLSDHEGFGNLYSCTPTGRDLRRHTHHEDFYVRFPSTDGQRIVFHAGADLFLFDPASGREKMLDIRILSSRNQLNRKFVPAGRYLERFDLHPQGHSLASHHRGGLYVMGLWEGASLRLGNQAGVRYRLAAWLPDGRRVVAVTDEGGEEGLAVLSATGETEASSPPGPERARGGRRLARGRITKKGRGGRRGRASAEGAGESAVPEAVRSKRIDGDFGRPVALAVAPAGAERVALANQRHELIVVDLATGASKVIERSPYSRMEGLAWSSDGRWLAYGYPSSNRTCSLHLWDSESGRITPITRPDFHDSMPAFDPEGRYLYFISRRIFDPVYDNSYFDLGFPKGTKPFLITLKRETVSPFSAATRNPRPPGTPPFDPNGRPANGAFKEASEGGAKKPEAEPPAKIEIDLEGMDDRIVAFPVAEGIYDRILGTRSRALFTSFPVEGSLEMGWVPESEPSAKGLLQAYNLEEDKTETVSDRVTDFTLSLDGKALGIRSGNRVRVVSSFYRAEGKPVREEAGRESGWVDLERLRVSVVPTEEWRQMFNEAWRLQRDQFWTSDMSGHDWKGVRERYLPLVDRVASRAEFSDLLWEMQGELGTSHCYELGGDYRPEPAWYQGFLGADLELSRRTGTWVVARLPRGDSWDEKRACPLAAPGINIHEGDEILAVAGLPVGVDVSPYERLVNSSARDVQLTVRAKAAPVRRPAARPAGRRGKRPAEAAPAERDARNVTVRTLREEYSIRYRDWVETNRARVHEESKGRIGYIHIPNMGPLGYSEFHRYFLSEVDRDGLIVDVRFNGGGHVSQLLLEKLVRRRIGYDTTRWGVPTSYPLDAPMGPMVALTNEYAGSDGDIFSHCFKLYGLGPLIGKRTWGGVVGIWPRHALVDGTVTTQPEFAFWFKDVGWGVENYGTDPDIEVEIRPQDHAAGRDPQLERGLLEVERLIRKLKPTVPDFKNRPRLRPARLPKI